MIFKMFAWVGMCVGLPSVAAWLTSVYLTLDEQFLIFFAFSAGALLIAIVPRLIEPPRS